MDGSAASANLPYCKLPATGQTTWYATGGDGDTRAGSDLALIRGDGNNANGTITDPRTGLMWEVKDNNDAGGVHDMDDPYTWADAVDPDGPFLNRLNNYCWFEETQACASDGDCTGVVNDECGLAGYRDWRLPNVSELQSIIDYEESDPSG